MRPFACMLALDGCACARRSGHVRTREQSAHTRSHLVAEAEDSHLLAGEVESGEPSVEEVIPGGAGALGVGVGMPGGRTADETIVAREVVRICDVDRVDASGSREIASDSLSVARSRRVDERDLHVDGSARRRRIALHDNT